jgi:hypothetical protein
MWLLPLLPSSRHFTTVGGERTNVSSRLIAISAAAEVTVAVAAGGDPSPLSDSDALADPIDGLPLRVRVRSPAGWYIFLSCDENKVK